MHSRDLALLSGLLAAVGASCADDDPAHSSVPLPSLDASLLDATLGEPADAGDAAARCANSVGLQDLDRDGFSREEGDCDDCNLARGPGSVDIPRNGIDEDCSGADALEDPVACDAELDPKDTDTKTVVQALGLCGEQVTRASLKSGLIASSWVQLSGTAKLRDARQVWLPEKFGSVTVHEGARLAVLSTGVARDVDAKDYTEGCDMFTGQLDSLGGWSGGQTPPKGFPLDSKRCSKGTASKGALAYDDVGLELTLRAPGNATALVFDSMFFTYEYPDYVCSRYNDFFVALMDPEPKAFDSDNVLVDSEQNPIGVNTALLSVCTASSRASVPIACSAGPSQLLDTGYGPKESSCAPVSPGKPDIGGASTGWLHTEVPVLPGEVFKLRFVLWDSGDPRLDSTVLLDALHFIARPPVVGTLPVTSG